MKNLVERKEIVEMMKNHECIKINRANPVNGFDTIYEGELVGVKVPSKRFGELTVYGTIHYYSEENKYYVQNVGCCIKASFGYEDVMKIKERKYAPTVSEGQEVILIEDFGSKCILRVMKAIRCNSQCSDACVLVDVE